jgi:hypothetical protein
VRPTTASKKALTSSLRVNFLIAIMFGVSMLVQMYDKKLGIF